MVVCAAGVVVVVERKDVEEGTFIRGDYRSDWVSRDEIIGLISPSSLYVQSFT